MADGYPAEFRHRFRVALVVASVMVTAPVLATTTSLSAPSLARGLTVALIAVQAVVLWWLPVHPGPVTAAVLLASGGLQLLYPTFGPGIALVVLCTYTWLRPAGETLWMLGLGAGAICAPALVGARWGFAAGWLGAVLLAWSWGALARARGERRVAERRRAVLEERARIARELHDVLSHTVSVMVVQAAAADDVFDANPQQAREALRRTEQAGREALTELRHFLRTVRADSDDETGPQPTLDDVDRLAATMRDTGLRVDVRTEDAADVPRTVQLTAYRIVQEALTNTLRHAAASAADVLLRVDESEVYVRIRDDGAGAGTTTRGSGQGLLGMRERAGLLGGTVETGPRPEGGFEVTARLPIRQATR